MDLEEKIKLVCEPCEVCKKPVTITISKKDLKHSASGVTTVVDIHGLDEQTKKEGKPPHVRILFVDEQNSVRSFNTVTSIAHRIEK